MLFSFYTPKTDKYQNTCLKTKKQKNGLVSLLVAPKVPILKSYAIYVTKQVKLHAFCQISSVLRCFIPSFVFVGYVCHRHFKVLSSKMYKIRFFIVLLHKS